VHQLVIKSFQLLRQLNQGGWNNGEGGRHGKDNSYNSMEWKFEEKDHIEEVGVDELTILKRILKT